MNLFDPLADIARSQIGAEEYPIGSNLGTAIAKFKAATNLDASEAFPWCAAFVDWCVAQYAQKYSLRLPDHFILPHTAGAFALADDWAPSAQCQVFFPTDAHGGDVGDVVVYRFSHCGIVSGVGPRGRFSAIEGNTNTDGGREGYEVAERRRDLTQVRNFIRLPQSRDYWEGEL